MKICQNCGFTCPDDAKFCNNCGSPLEVAAPVPQPIQQPVPQAQKKSPLIPILITIVAVVFIIVVGMVVVSFLGGGSSDSYYTTEATEALSTQESTTETTTEATTESTTQTTTAATTQQQIVNKFYIYPGYVGSTDEGWEYIGEDGYLFPSDTEYLTEAFLDTQTKDQIAFIRNEIYARHGYIFKRSKFENYFNQQSWYHGYEPEMDEAAKSFNKVERANMNTIVKYEKKHGWRK